MQRSSSQKATKIRILSVLCCLGLLYLLFAAIVAGGAIHISGIGTGATNTASSTPGGQVTSSAAQTLDASAPPSLENLPSYCPSPLAVTAAVSMAFPTVRFDQAYEIDPVAQTCIPAPTLVFPDGEQLAVIVKNGSVTSQSQLRPGTTSSVVDSVTRWSGYEPFSSSEEPVLEVAAQQDVPATSVPPTYYSENSTMQGNCCSLSIWTGQADSKGGLDDGKLIQIGVDIEVSGLTYSFGYQYVGFYEALPSAAILFNQTQVPCGMPKVGQSFSSSVTNEGAHNSTTWEYALMFKNNSCASGYYVVYTTYAMNALYGEIQSEAPARCLFGQFLFQTQPPQFSGDNITSAAVSFDDGGQRVSYVLGETSMNGGVINLNTESSDTSNSPPGSQSGQFSTMWLSSASNLGYVSAC